MYTNFLHKIFLGNIILNYLYAIIVFFALFFVLKFFQNKIVDRFKKTALKTKTKIDDIFISVLSSIKPQFYLTISFWISIQIIYVDKIISEIVNSILVIVITYQFLHSLNIAILDAYRMKNDEKSAKNIVNIFNVIVKIFVWSFILLLILSNFGVNITSLITGLGIGGIAIAFAVQNILSDLFSSISIYLDKPFIIGDFIKSENVSGIVKKIGIKTTRIKSLEGEEIIIPNKILSSKLLHNYGRIKNRMVFVKLGIEYSTDRKYLKDIPNLLKDIVKKYGAIFERCHLKEFKDSSIEFELVYSINSGDYIEYLNLNQNILLGIKDKFDELGISFAFPSQTIYVKNS